MAIVRRGKYWHYEFMIDGRKYRGSTKETVKSRAQTVEALKIADVRNHGGNLNLRRAPVLRDFAPRFLSFNTGQVEAGHLKPVTNLYYQGGWKMLSDTTLAGMRMDQIETRHAAVLSFPGTPSNANRALRTLSRMLRMAEEWKVIRSAPRIKLLKELGRTTLIEPATEALLLEHAAQPLRDILVIMMDSGMRPEEAMRMRKEQILWDRSVILVPYGKTLKSKRYVPLSQRMTEVLGVRVAGDSPWVFPSRRAGSGHLTTVARQWRETVRAANKAAAERNLPPVPSELKLYCARHTFATDMLDEGLHLAKVSELLGHGDVKTTMKYVHPDTRASAAVVDRRNHANQLRVGADTNFELPQNSHSGLAGVP